MSRLMISVLPRKKFPSNVPRFGRKVTPSSSQMDGKKMDLSVITGSLVLFWVWLLSCAFFVQNPFRLRALPNWNLIQTRSIRTRVGLIWPQTVLLITANDDVRISVGGLKMSERPSTTLRSSWQLWRDIRYITQKFATSLFFTCVIQILSMCKQNSLQRKRKKKTFTYLKWRPASSSWSLLMARGISPGLLLVFLIHLFLVPSMTPLTLYLPN